MKPGLITLRVQFTFPRLISFNGEDELGIYDEPSLKLVVEQKCQN